MKACLTRDIYDTHGKKRLTKGQHVKIKRSVDTGYVLVTANGYTVKLPASLYELV